KVPFIFRIPGLAPRKLSMPVGHVDLLPTLVNLLGQPATPAMAGRSLLGEIAGTADGQRDRFVFQEVTYEGPTERRAVVSKPRQLIYNVVPANTFELYDLGVPWLQAQDLWGRENADA